MKKLLSIAFVMVSVMFISSSADAQTWRNQGNNRANQQNNQRQQQNNRQIVRTYNETKTVFVRSKQYLETYQIQVFRNGRKTSKLISRVEVKNRRGNNNNNDRYDNGKVSYKTSTIWQNGRKYKVTYKITKFRNGQTKSEIIKKVRV